MLNKEFKEKALAYSLECADVEKRTILTDDGQWVFLKRVFPQTSTLPELIEHEISFQRFGTKTTKNIFIYPMEDHKMCPPFSMYALKLKLQ
jgi:hypothetical protein